MTTTKKAKPTKKAPAKAAPTKTLATKKPARASAQPTAAPGAIPVGGTDTQEQALATGLNLSEAEAYSLTLDNVEPGTLSRIVDKFNGVPMTDVPIPQSEALEAQPAIVFTGEAPALAPADDAPKTPVQDAFGSAADQKATPPPAKRQAAIGMRFAQRVTRLKMTLHSVAPLVPTPTVADGVENPLTRCTFGAVYSADEVTEDAAYGKATPFGTLSYNVRSDLAAALEVGAAYYIDIQKVPS